DIAAAHLVIGQLRQAEAALEKATVREPRNAAVHLSLARLRPFVPGDPRLAALEKLEEIERSLGEKDRVALHFALGKAYDDLDRGELSFHHLLEGNALKRRLTAYDENTAL